MKCKRCGEEMYVKDIGGRNYFVCENCKIKKAIVDDSDDEYTEITPLNKCLIFSIILTILYFVYSFVYWSDPNILEETSQSAFDLATFLVAPHFVFVLLAALFDVFALFTRKRPLALISGIFYILSIILLPFYVLFVIVQTVLSFVAFFQLKKTSQ